MSSIVFAFFPSVCLFLSCILFIKLIANSNSLVCASVFSNMSFFTRCFLFTCAARCVETQHSISCDFTDDTERESVTQIDQGEKTEKERQSGSARDGLQMFSRVAECT